MSHFADVSTDRVVDLLREVDLFRGLPPEELARIAGIAEDVPLEDGEVVFEQGAPGDAFFVVYEGAVELLVEHADGTEEKLAVKRRGGAFGEMALLDGESRSATARAVEASRLVRLSREDFLELLGDAALPRHMLAFLSRNLRSLDKRLAAMEKLGSRATRDSAGPDGAGRDGTAGAGAATDDDGAADDVPDADPSEISRVVQRGLMPRTAPDVDGYDIAAGTTTEPTGRGDTVWDWVELPSAEVAMMAVDVQGEGLPPSHHLVGARVLLRSLTAEYSSPRDILPRANAAMSRAQIVGADQFVECGIVVLHEDSLEWASAGRVPAGVIRRAGTFEELGSHGPPLGMMEGFRYGSQRLEMGPGDVFVALSQASMGLFRGAADLVAQVQGKTAGEVVQTLHRAIRKAGSEGTPRETSVIFIRKH